MWSEFIEKFHLRPVAFWLFVSSQISPNVTARNNRIFFRYHDACPVGTRNLVRPQYILAPNLFLEFPNCIYNPPEEISSQGPGDSGLPADEPPHHPFVSFFRFSVHKVVGDPGEMEKETDWVQQDQAADHLRVGSHQPCGNHCNGQKIRGISTENSQ